MENILPCCYRCVKEIGCHSTIFGECWTCEAKNPNMSDIMDNDSDGVEITPCESFLEGMPSGGWIG